MRATKPSVESRTQTIRDVPVPLWRALKAKCASQGVTIRSVILRLLESYIK